MLRHAAASAPLARRRMVADLTASGVRADAVDDAQLVLGELLGNAVRHGTALPGDALDVSWEVHDRALELRVTDGGNGLPERRALRDVAESGRGLAIVDTLAASWGVDHPRDGGTTVWAVVSL